MGKRQWMADKLGAGLIRIHTTVGGIRERVNFSAGAPRPGAARLLPTPSRTPRRLPETGPIRPPEPSGPGDGPVLVLDGRVLDVAGRPLAGVTIDCWPAVADPPVRGASGPVSDLEGCFRLTAPRPAPAARTGAPPLLNVSLRRTDGATLTTCLYFPDQDNRADPDFDPRLLMSYREQSPRCLHARFDFVLNPP